MRIHRIVPLAVALAIVPADAADPVALRSLFPHEADVTVSAPGLARLDLPPELLAACRPDLSNLRLFDAEGNEIPFLVDAPRPGVARSIETVTAPPLEVGREEMRREGRPNLRRETYELAGPARLPQSGAWAIVIDTPRPAFVARVEARAGEAASRGSMFRIETPRRAEKLSLAIGTPEAARVTIVLEHEHPFWIEPSFRFESTVSRAIGSRTAIPLEVVSKTSTAGTTVVELERPRGVVPEALRIDTATATFDRRFAVRDEGPGRDAAALAEGALFRLLPGTGVEDLELPMRPARGDRLRVVIEDGDSPPLEGLTFAAVFGQPSLVASFPAAGADGAPAAILRFGGERARVPRYDLAGLRPEPGRDVYGRRAEALVRLYDPASIGTARLGPMRPNPSFDAAPALAFAMRPGAEIDTRPWRTRRALDLGRSPEGLARIRILPEDMAALRADFGDLRIVDDASHQWPYLVDREASTADVPLTIVATTSKNRATTYRLEAAFAPLTIDRIVLDVEAPFFDRPYRLRGERDDGGTVDLGAGRLARRTGDAAPVAIDLPRTRLEDLELTVDDGDDAPLALRSVRGTAPVPDVFVAAPEGRYWMLLGADDAEPPRYELERVRDVVLAVESAAVVPGAPEKNPRHSAAARLAQGRGREQALMWIVIIAAVVVLGVLTLRLARREPS